VVTENDRVLKTAAAIKRLDMGAIGELLADSHASMRDDYEISLPAIDRLAQIACGTTGCYGARLTGAGFGGAVIALVDSEAVNAFAATAIDQYRAETNKPGSVLHVLSDEGVRLEQTR
jgi:galactokinase